jgi:hypothetical protein
MPIRPCVAHSYKYLSCTLLLLLNKYINFIYEGTDAFYKYLFPLA